MPDNRPIGILDSGIGGLTVASAISTVLPNEQVIYFGDTAHLPYGDKSKELIKKYTQSIAEFLINENQSVVLKWIVKAWCMEFLRAISKFESNGYKDSEIWILIL